MHISTSTPVLKTALIIMQGLVAFLTFNLGMDYINFDYGLHPIIAFPIMTLMVVGIYFVQHNVSECSHSSQVLRE